MIPVWDIGKVAWEGRENMYTVKEQDWKLFRKKLPLWQQAHMNTQG